MPYLKHVLYACQAFIESTIIADDPYEYETSSTENLVSACRIYIRNQMKPPAVLLAEIITRLTLATLPAKDREALTNILARMKEIE